MASAVFDYPEREDGVEVIEEGAIGGAGSEAEGAGGYFGEHQQ